ncbi:DUF411 domain-containing protein [Vogesella oryzae]|uniref:DUF411 domain-containing protein n=1 Tax=Vogesella oryzae TaxID=1735285 RepID=UPI001583CBDE|nr:DUF411 domain-containing protein [Vogesella oryzae]
MTRLPRLLFTLAVLSPQVFAAAMPVTLYKSPSCGCCEAYVSYLGSNGFKVDAINRNDMDKVKTQYKVGALQSCHTALVGGYVVEGHVPVAAIRKLLRDKPDIVGITAPGMPANSPGMGVMKPGTLTIYALTRQQSAKPVLFSVE